ncbi:MAG: hypothetical protein IJA97_04605 [Clostridia bacterium]|nr:hypothetical protein [Clostridia bacterium]
MLEFLSIISDVLFVFFIVSSVVFGLSFAVRFYAIKTVKKVIRESDKNFDKCVDIEKSSTCETLVSEHIERYLLYAEQERRANKAKKANKIRKLFSVKQKEEVHSEDKLKDISLSLLKSISSVFEGGGGYLNYSKNEIIDMLKKLCSRLNAIFDASGIIWLKTVKISSIVHIISLTKTIEKFKGKTLVLLACYVIDFCLFISRFISPVGASKKLVSSVMADNFSSLIVTAVFTVVGKEWAVLCAEKERSRLKLKNDKKVA